MGKRKTKKKRKECKNWVLAILCLQLAILLSSCAAFQVGGDITQGRMELLYGDPKVALTHFQRAAQTDPDYRLNYSIFPEGVWTYVGRAYYATGDLQQARQALGRARREHPEDNLAGVYLGLVLFQNGDRGSGLREIEAGLNGVVAWYDYVDLNHTDGQFWDPDRQIRSAIQKQLAVMAGREVNAKELIENVAWLGREIEIEIDRAKVHRLRDWDRRHPEGDR
ncbi:MAG TPA: tetratricopeptide repeat protein [Candidatus Binatia bacterium]|jgi:tetratricopeptide (TPR) repeat protein|nr:tetratricopeptide repeat protein [Candidatus Binatia bacterium]